MVDISIFSDEQYLGAAKVLSRYGVSDMTIHRWLRDPSKEFPQPVYLGRRRYWKLSDLVAWEKKQIKPRSSVRGYAMEGWE